VDINEGFKPQTYESINILKQYKTPFIIAVNKIDKISGWKKSNELLSKRIASQRTNVKTIFKDKIFELIGILYENKFQAELYYKIQDFRKNIAIIPISSKTGEGIPELLMTLVGLAQKFLEEKLHNEIGPAKGSVLEVKEEVGLGTTIDSIIYSGILRCNDKIVIGTKDDPIIAKIKALLKPKPLDEIRDPRERFDNVKEVHAASGIKILSPDLDKVIPGAPIRVVQDNIDEIIQEIKNQTKIDLELDEQGIVIKADTIGSLEALIKESRDKNIQIRKAEIGNVSKRDVVESNATLDQLNKVIFAFNVKILPEAKEELLNSDLKIFNEDVIYTIMENYDEWIEKKKSEIELKRRKDYIHPGMIKILPEYIFRVNNPAIVGIRVLAGRIKNEMKLINDEGRYTGRIKGIQSENQSVNEAIQGEEVAISIDGVTVGRQIKKDDILYTDIPEKDAKKLKEMNILNIDEEDILNKIFKIKRKNEKFWGM
jgi:translation initiation factor 5B